MSAVIEIMDIRATIDNYRWTSKDRVIEEFLNSQLDPSGPDSWLPDPDRVEAQRIVDKYGAVLIENKPPKYEYSSEVEY